MFLDCYYLLSEYCATRLDAVRTAVVHIFAYGFETAEVHTAILHPVEDNVARSRPRGCCLAHASAEYSTAQGTQ